MEKNNYDSPPRTSDRVYLSKCLRFKESSSTGECKIIDAEIVNISPGGMCISTNRTLSPGQIIRILLQFQDTEIEVPSIVAVMWSRPKEDNIEICELGLQFLT